MPFITSYFLFRYKRIAYQKDDTKNPFAYQAGNEIKFPTQNSLKFFTGIFTGTR